MQPINQKNRYFLKKAFDFYLTSVYIYNRLDGYLTKLERYFAIMYLTACRTGHYGLGSLVERISSDYDSRLSNSTWVDLLRVRLCMLEPRDRVLVEMYINQGVSFVQLSQLSGRPARLISREVHKLIGRLLDNKGYIQIRRKSLLFSRKELALAYDRYLLGLSYRRIAAKRSMTVKRVRRLVGTLDEWLEINNQ